jgi:predicted 3-demethylubiquinone-9 3-methyltransferase (glyoxalase superfamily)
MNGISTFLWFDDQAYPAASFYVSVFPGSRITSEHDYVEGSMGDPGSIMTVTFELDGRPFVALNGGPMYSFTPAISLVVNCADQDEVDHYWERLTEGGEPGRCGWLVDRFGVSWQVVPDGMGEILGGPDPAGAARATSAMLAMSKLDVAELRRAYDGA